MKLPFIFAAITIAASSFAQGSVVLVDTQTNNGGFETGSASPWVNIPLPNALGLSVKHTIPAYEGTYYGQLDANGPSSGGSILAAAYMPLSLSQINGNTLEVILYAGAFTQSLNTLNVYIIDSSLTQYQGTLTTQGSIVSNEWNQFVYNFVLPESFTYTGVSKIVFEMGRVSTVPGNKYAGYIDAVTVIQSIPEPSAVALLLCGVAFYFSTRLVWNRAS